MNIFVLDRDPIKAAQTACDKHVIKMILETTQLLCSAYDSAPYRRTHYNHPCSIWVRKSRVNYEWAIKYAYALNDEYRFRYESKKDHASIKVVDWCSKNSNTLNLSDDDNVEFVLVVPEEFKSNDVVESYRAYYRKDKASFAKWTKRNIPDWFY